MMDEYLEIINPEDPIDACYGLEIIELSHKHVKALLEGKQIYTTINAGEYAIIVKINSDLEVDEE